jgi:hypothetical protein
VAPPGYVAEVLVQTGTSTEEISSNSFAGLDAAKVNVTVPDKETGRLLVFFNAETACFGGTAGAHCMVRITVDNNEIAPAAGDDSTFDSNGATATSLHTQSTQAQHGIVRISPVLSPGTHTVRVEFATTSTATKLRLDDWTLAVQRIRVT